MHQPGDTSLHQHNGLSIAARLVIAAMHAGVNILPLFCDKHWGINFAYGEELEVTDKKLKYI